MRRGRAGATASAEQDRERARPGRRLHAHLRRGAVRVGAVDDPAERSADRLARALLGAETCSVPVADTSGKVRRTATSEKTLLELATEHNFPIDVTIRLAGAGYHIQFRTEAQMMKRIEKYTPRNLEHRQWLITQLSDRKLKDLYPGDT